jgi:hypothetical protein
MTDRPRPNFFIVGAPKCGTTAWVEYLSRHPKVFFNEVKETHVFASDFRNYRAATTIEAFLDFYEEAGDATILGDASPWHMRSEVAARNLKEFNPDARILILLREIGVFIPSYHNQVLLNGDEPNSDLATVWAQSGPARRVPSCCRDPKLIDYKTIGAFGSQVARYMSEFSADQIRVAWMEDWRQDPVGFYRFLLEFLELEWHPAGSFEPVNVARRHKSRLLAAVLHDRKVVKPMAQMLRRVGAPRMGIYTRVREANIVEGYDTVAPDELIAEIRAHYRDDAERLRGMLDGSGIVYVPPSAR